MSVQNVITIHPTVGEILQSGSKWRTNQKTQASLKVHQDLKLNSSEIVFDKRTQSIFDAGFTPWREFYLDIGRSDCNSAVTGTFRKALIKETTECKNVLRQCHTEPPGRQCVPEQEHFRNSTP